MVIIYTLVIKQNIKPVKPLKTKQNKNKIITNYKQKRHYRSNASLIHIMQHNIYLLSLSSLMSCLS